jgi:hypothetical protein
MSEGAGDLDGDLDGVVGAQGAFAEALGEALTTKVLEHQIGQVSVFSNGEDCDDIGVSKEGDAAGFSLEQTDVFGSGAGVGDGADDLDDDLPPEFEIAGEEYNSHTSAGYFSDDLVGISHNAAWMRHTWFEGVWRGDSGESGDGGEQRRVVFLSIGHLACSPNLWRDGGIRIVVETRVGGARVDLGVFGGGWVSRCELALAACWRWD